MRSEVRLVASCALMADGLMVYLMQAISNVSSRISNTLRCFYWPIRVGVLCALYSVTGYVEAVLRIS